MMSLSKMFKAAMAGAALMSAISMQAENKVYIENFTVSGYDIIDMPVMIEVTDDVNQAQCRVTLPDGLNVNGTVTLNREVFPDFFRVDTNTINNEDGSTTIVLGSFDLNNRKVAKGTNVWATIPIQAEYGLLDAAGTKEISLHEIVLASPQETNVAVSRTGTTTVTLQQYSEEKAATLVCSNAPVTVNPGDTRQASISMTNNFPVKGFQFDIYPPEHITIGNVLGSSRIPEGWQFIVRDNTDDPAKGYVRVIALGTTLLSVGEGELLTIDITADEEFYSSENISLSKFILSAPQNVGVNGTAPTFEVVSGQIALEQAMLLISEGEGSLAEYITTAMGIVAEECPLVAEDFNFMPFFNEVQTLMAAAETAYNDYTLTDNFDTIVTEPIAEVKQEVDAFVADARAAQAAEAQRLADNEAAYNADIAAIDALQASLDAAKAQIREEYAGFEDEAAEAAVQAQIDALRTAADAAYAAVAEEGNYENTIDTAAVEAAIAALVTNAQNASDAAEAARVAANLEAYNADIAAIDALQTAFDAAKTEVSELYPGFENEEAENAVQAEIDALRAAADAAYAAVAEEGNYEYELDTTAVQAEIDGFAETSRVAYNTSLYNADIAEITAIEAEYNSVLSVLQKLNPELLEDGMVVSVGNDIAAARQAIEESYAAVAEEGVYPAPAFDAQSLRDEIDAMLNAIGTGISEILIDGAVEGVEIYTTDGQRHSKLVSGQINILRIGNKTVKVIVK